MKKLLSAIFILLFILSLTGCIKSKEFKKDDFKITLTSEFEESKQSKMTYFFKSDLAGVAILKEKFEDLKLVKLDKDSTLEDYKNVIVEHTYQKVEVKKEKNFYYFTYISTRNNITYYYFTAMFKGKDAFWLVNYFTLKENAKNLEKEFLKYSKSVKIKD